MYVTCAIIFYILYAHRVYTASLYSSVVYAQFDIRKSIREIAGMKYNNIHVYREQLTDCSSGNRNNNNIVVLGDL